MKQPAKIVIRPRFETEPATSPPAKSGRTITLYRPYFIAIVGTACLLIGLFSWLWIQQLVKARVVSKPTVAPSSQVESLPGDFGIRWSDYKPEKDVLSDDLALEKYLQTQDLSEPVVRELVQQAEGKGIDRLEKGHEIIMLTPRNSDSEAGRLFLYEMSASKSVLFKLKPRPTVEVKLKAVENRIRAAGGIIKTTLWEAVLDYNIHYRVIDQMEEAMKWSVDFYHLQPGDKFKVIYEEKYAGNEIAGIGQLKAVYFKTGGTEHYAMWVEGIEKPGYYDELGQPVQQLFLKCPVKYERITSFYNPARLHPVTGKVQPHFGTDFAASQGSPIFAVGDGQVEAADFTANNGNYVKLRHNPIYETQYLHMERFEPGMRQGMQVKQGQVIGYVGQTGLATGPHVCFRFWKNGLQVDPREEPEQRRSYMSLKDQDRYLEQKNLLEQQLQEIVYFDGKF